jgi:simple sugar transport system ATP-binding protein
VEDLPVGLRQRVEIVRALYQGGRTLILDEPTALLTPQEVEELYGILERLRADGGTIIFITHKLREIAAISDRVTVIQRGRTVGTHDTKLTDAAQLAELMVGRNVKLQVERTPGHPGEVLLEADHLRSSAVNGKHAVDDASLIVRAGEIVGVCGIEGNGQSELIEILAGLRKPESGLVRIAGVDVTGQNPNRLREAGLSYIPEDRHGRGLVLDFSLTENMLLGNLDVEPFCDGNRINYPATEQITIEGMKKFDVRAPGAAVDARTLSGGNQQKFIIAREMYRNPKVILAVQPTRGLDVGAIEFVHKQLVAQRDGGHAILVVSFELDEVLDLSDRILVLFDGRIVGEFINGEVDRATLGLLMGGRSLDDRQSIPAAVA